MPVTRQNVFDALVELGGVAHLTHIVQRVRAIAEPPLPEALPNVVRARLQENSADSESYRGGPNLFYSVHGVDQRMGEWGIREIPIDPNDNAQITDVDDLLGEADEGHPVFRNHLVRERSSALVRAFKRRLMRCECCVCGFDFERAYGEIGRNYIEAHHTAPVAQLGNGGVTRIDDLVAVCSNCHRMLHRRQLMDWRNLRNVVQQLRE